MELGFFLYLIKLEVLSWKNPIKQNKKLKYNYPLNSLKFTEKVIY